MEYSSYSKRFQDIASLYVKDGIVLKYRGGDKQALTKEDIKTEADKNNRVIIEKNKYLYCYFKDDEKFRITNIIESLKHSNLDIEGKVELV